VTLTVALSLRVHDRKDARREVADDDLPLGRRRDEGRCFALDLLERHDLLEIDGTREEAGFLRRAHRTMRRTSINVRLMVAFSTSFCRALM
jgi:hypothetical protein